MNNIAEYYDDIADISVATREAINSLESAREKVQLALGMIRNVKKHNSDTPISHVSSVTKSDVHCNLLFLESLLNQTFGVINTSVFRELLELTNYSINEEDEL